MDRQEVTAATASFAAEAEARQILAQHLVTVALGGNHPNAVVVPRDALTVTLAHRCGVKTTGEFVAILPDGEVVGPFPSVAEVDKWADAQPEADSIVKTKLVGPGWWR